MKAFELSIISPEKTVYKGRVVSLVAPAHLGYLGVLADHAPLIAALKKGKIIFKEESGEQKAFQCEDKGFLEVLKNNVTILLDKGLIGG